MPEAQPRALRSGFRHRRDVWNHRRDVWCFRHRREGFRHRGIRHRRTNLILFTSEAHSRSHDVLWQGQTKSNEGFLGPMEKGFPLVSEGDGAVVRTLRTEHWFVTYDTVLMFFAVPKTTVNYFLRNWNTKLAKFFTSFVCLVQERCLDILGLPFVVFSVANCITLRTGCIISRSCPA